MSIFQTSGSIAVAALCWIWDLIAAIGHSMFGFAVGLGLLLWLGHRAWPQSYPDVVAGGAWMHAKLGLVALLLAYYIFCGRMLKRAMAGAALPSATRLRWLNELPVLLVVVVIYLVLAKPF